MSFSLTQPRSALNPSGFVRLISLKALSKMFSNLIVRSFITSSKQLNLNGKTAVVVAGTKGIGFAIARRLGLAGADVVVSSRKQSNVDKAVSTLQDESLKVIGFPCHAGKSDDRKRLLTEVKKIYGGFDILVSNAGINLYFGETLKTAESAFDYMMQLNVKTTFQLIQESVPIMTSRPNPSITVMSSQAGSACFDHFGIYSVGKAALTSLTKVLTPELARKNIRINCIGPGMIETDFNDPSNWSPHTKDYMGNIVSNIPFGRQGSPEECSGIVAFLSSDEATYITGQTIYVDGGFLNKRS